MMFRGHQQVDSLKTVQQAGSHIQLDLQRHIVVCRRRDTFADKGCNIDSVHSHM